LAANKKVNNLNKEIKASMKPKKKREPFSKIIVRIIAFALVILMLAGSLYMVLEFLFIKAQAQEYDSDLMLRVGLMYGDGVTIGFETTADNGFALGYVDASNKFTALTQVTDTALSVTCDCNLSNTNRTFAKTDSVNPAVGGYHLEVSGSNLIAYYDSIAQVFSSCGYTAFPSYINGAFCIRAGSFGTLAAAQIAASSLPDIIINTVNSLSGNITTVSPSSTAVTVVNPSTNAIVFEFDSADRSMGMGMEALQVWGSETAYLVTPAKNKYDGVFEFQRNFPAYTDGVALTSIVTLEQYTLGVLPYEIGSSWPLEAQKAFAVAVRSYALSHLNKHYNSYGFDVCNGTDCQVYRGIGSTGDIARQAVAETAGQVMVYNNTIASTFFSSSTGGTTVSAADAWGSDPAKYPYLAAKATPWEHYAEHTYGEWTSEASPTELFNTLRAKGYTLLRGSIANIVINSTADNSTYVTSITFYDIYGTAVTITKSDTIRSVLGTYVRSANFSVAQAGQSVVLKDYYYTDASDVFGTSGNSGTGIVSASAGTNNSGASSSKYILPSATSTETASTSSLSIITSAGQAASAFVGSYGVITASGIGVLSSSDSQTAITSSGTKYVLPDESELNSNNYGDGSGTSSLLPQLSTLAVSISTRYVTATGTAGNFVFVGRGYGHGVGMSQWGVYDLAKLGYGYSDILSAYYNGTVVADYRTTSNFN
jgi:SpoIID/LytB domain